MEETKKFHLLKGWPEASDPGSDALDLNTLIIDDHLPLAFGFDIRSSFGLVEGHTGGYVYDASGNIVKRAPGTYTLTKNATNYVGRDLEGNIVVSLVGFAKGIIPLRISKTDESGVYEREDVRMPNLGREVATTTTSFNGRDGAVMPADGDYTASQISIDPLPELSAEVDNVQEALDALTDKIANHRGAVSSVFGRTGDIVAAKGDYPASLIGINDIPSLGDADNVQEALDRLATKLQTEAVFSFNGRHGDITPQVGDYTAAMVTCTPPSGFSSTNLQDLIEEYKTTFSAIQVGASSFNGRQGAILPQYGDYDASQIAMYEELVAGRTNVQTTLEAILEYLRNSGIPVITSNTSAFYTLSAAGTLDIALPLTAVGGSGALTYTIETGTTADLNATIDNVTKTLRTNCTIYGPKTLNIKVTDSSTPTAKTATKSFSFVVTNLAITTPATNAVSIASGITNINFALAATGGTAPYRFELVSSTIPGASLSGNTIQSTSVANATYQAVVKCVDAANLYVTKTISIAVTITGTIKMTVPATVDVTDSTPYDNASDSFHVTQVTMEGIPSGKTPTYSAIQTSGPTISSSLIGIKNYNGTLYFYIVDPSVEGSGTRTLTNIGNVYKFNLRAMLDGYTEQKEITVTDRRSALPLVTVVTPNGGGCFVLNDNDISNGKQITLSATLSSSGGSGATTFNATAVPAGPSNHAIDPGTISISGNILTLKTTLPVYARDNSSHYYKRIQAEVTATNSGGQPIVTMAEWDIQCLRGRIAPQVANNYSDPLSLAFTNTVRNRHFALSTIVIPGTGVTYSTPFYFPPGTTFVGSNCSVGNGTIAFGAVEGVAYITSVPPSDSNRFSALTGSIQVASSITDLMMWHRGMYGPTAAGTDFPSSVTISKAKYSSRINLGLAIKTNLGPDWHYGPFYENNYYGTWLGSKFFGRETIDIIIHTVSAPVGGMTIWVSGDTSSYTPQSLTVNVDDKGLVPIGRYELQVTVRPKGDTNNSRGVTKTFIIDVVE